jgi:hypothetical protein
MVKYYANKRGWLDDTAYIIRKGCFSNAVKKNGEIGCITEWSRNKDHFVESGDWIEITEEAAHKLLGAFAPKRADIVTESADRKADFSMFIKKEEVTMEKATAIKVATGVAKFAGKWGWRTVNYWAFEPMTEVATKIMRAVRYVTLTGAIVGGVYTYNNPEKAMDLFKSCLPKITIESPEIMKS